MENKTELKQVLRRGLDDFIFKVILMATVMKKDTPNPDSIDEACKLCQDGLKYIQLDSSDFSTFACAFRTMITLCEQVMSAMAFHGNQVMLENKQLKAQLAELKKKQSDEKLNDSPDIDPVAASSSFDALMAKIKGE